MQNYKEYASKDWVKNQLEHIEIKDIGNSCTYVLQLKNGALILTSKATSIEVTTMPIKTEYIEGVDSTLDLSGMVISAIREDGTKDIVDNYTYTETRTDNAITVDIQYNEFGEAFHTTLELTIISFDPEVQLVDFEYTAESDGTYTLTGWKQTLNGEPSTELIIPDNSLINL